MCMALNTEMYNKEAKQALEELPQSALTLYLKAILASRMGGDAGDMEACMILNQVFTMDSKFIK